MDPSILGVSGQTKSVRIVVAFKIAIFDTSSWTKSCSLA